MGGKNHHHIPSVFSVSKDWEKSNCVVWSLVRGFGKRLLQPNFSPFQSQSYATDILCFFGVCPPQNIVGCSATPLVSTYYMSVPAVTKHQSRQ